VAVLKIEVEENDYLYLADIFCWLKGYISAKGKDSEDSIFLEKGVRKLDDIMQKIKRGEKNE